MAVILALEGNSHAEPMVSVLKVVAIQHGGYGGGDAVAQFLFIAQAQLHQVVDLGAYEGILLQVVDHAQIDDHISALLFTSAASPPPAPLVTSIPASIFSLAL